MWKKIALAALLLGIINYSLPKSAAADKAYAAKIQQSRRLKNQQFRTAADSPIPLTQKPAFDSLRYFAPVLSYQVNAKLSRLAATAPPLSLPRTDGAPEAYRRWGTADFTLPGQSQSQRLLLLQKISPAGAQEPLFVAFADATSGHETYATGRYLDLPVPAQDATEITLDFNLAYNPYCAYNPAYSCPLPPAENRLLTAVPAGEKSFHD